ncbi:MAG: type II toxin-antitoxin system RelE/ParE family toxin [Planctomycetota bacterium]
MMSQLILRPQAEADLAEAYAWYEERRAGLGQSLLLSVEAALASIRENPLLFPVVHGNIRRALIRRFPFGVYYLVDRETVVVVAIFHASRDPKGWRLRS